MQASMLTLQESFAKVQRNLCRSGIGFGCKLANLQGQASACPARKHALLPPCPVVTRIRARPGWDKIPAVKNNRIIEIKSPLILQPGPAALTDGLDAIVKALWP